MINRLDEVVVFNSLEQSHVNRIVAMILDEAAQKLARRNLDFQVANGVTEHLAKLGYDRSFGARQLRRTVEDTVLKPLSRILLAQEAKTFFRVFLTLDNGEIRINLE